MERRSGHPEAEAASGSRPFPKPASGCSGPVDAAIERGRSDDNERKRRDESGNSKGGRNKREFGLPGPKAQHNHTEPASRNMKRAGGRFNTSHNAQTAVDDTVHTIVTADVGNAVDVGQLLPMFRAVNDSAHQDSCRRAVKMVDANYPTGSLHPTILNRP